MEDSFKRIQGSFATLIVRYVADWVLFWANLGSFEGIHGSFERMQGSFERI